MFGACKSESSLAACKCANMARRLCVVWRAKQWSPNTHRRNMSNLLGLVCKRKACASVSSRGADNYRVRAIRNERDLIIARECLLEMGSQRHNSERLWLIDVAASRLEARTKFRKLHFTLAQTIAATTTSGWFGQSILAALLAPSLMNSARSSSSSGSIVCRAPKLGYHALQSAT